MTYEARLVTRFTGLWSLYVVTDGQKASDWPAFEFSRASAPNWAERMEALATLGYEPVNLEADWEWLELSEPDDYRVRLLARFPVQSLTGKNAS
ncbi:DUF6303 family protein [Streptomyces sp. NPDC048659]|uniref:DUF6303 family protein n=1 Tax=Streptomyces sp. NPDC048659 TaxID=3155489 RepID=UPI00341B0F04